MAKKNAKKYNQKMQKNANTKYKWKHNKLKKHKKQAKMPV